MSYMDKETWEIISELEQGKLKSSLDVQAEKKIAMKAAESFLRKDSRINIRLSNFDVTLLKRKAAEKGLPYQSLISSVLHRFATGRLDPLE
ncbi:MAG: hypothetical protein K0Q51_1446 [Rickettsiaceae bacterium]|nr:hypothetical protein [Rickettsiaceae bacterium]